LYSLASTPCCSAVFSGVMQGVPVGWTHNAHKSCAIHALHSLPSTSCSHGTRLTCAESVSELTQHSHRLCHNMHHNSHPLPSLQSCGTCKEVLQHCSQLCQENSHQRAGVLFLKHNIWNDFDDLTDVARMYKAKAVPSFIFLTGGAMVHSHSLLSALYSCSVLMLCAYCLRSHFAVMFHKLSLPYTAHSFIYH